MAVNMQEIACYVGERPQRIRGYAWVIFALTFGLLLSDYMSRQVLSAVFPQIKAEWGLSEHNRHAKYYRLSATGRRRLVAGSNAWHDFVEAASRALRANAPASA